MRGKRTKAPSSTDAECSGEGSDSSDGKAVPKKKAKAKRIKAADEGQGTAKGKKRGAAAGAPAQERKEKTERRKEKEGKRAVEQLCMLCGVECSTSCHNWSAKTQDEYGCFNPASELCADCAMFAERSGLDEKEVGRQVKKGGVLKAELEADRAEYGDVMQGGRKQFRPQGVAKNEGVLLEVIESFDCMPRKLFKRQYGEGPEKMGLSVCSITRARGRREKVVLLERAERLPVLQVSHFRVFERREEIMRPDMQAYTRQPERVYGAAAASSLKNLGATLADKYIGQKSVRSYDEKTLRSMVAKYQEKARRLGGWLGCAGRGAGVLRGGRRRGRRRGRRGRRQGVPAGGRRRPGRCAGGDAGAGRQGQA
jgi:hypothetical protein